MDRDATLSLLSHHKLGMQAQFGVRTLALFGSRARAQSGTDSDIDLLVEFDGPATSARYFGLQFFLEDLLGAPVDLVTRQALRPELRPFVERDAIHV
jgi:predicted nucleotidyltransferase